MTKLPHHSVRARSGFPSLLDCLLLAARDHCLTSSLPHHWLQNREGPAASPQNKGKGPGNPAQNPSPAALPQGIHLCGKTPRAGRDLSCHVPGTPTHSTCLPLMGPPMPSKLTQNQPLLFQLQGHQRLGRRGRQWTRLSGPRACFQPDTAMAGHMEANRAHCHLEPRQGGGGLRVGPRARGPPSVLKDTRPPKVPGGGQCSENLNQQRDPLSKLGLGLKPPAWSLGEGWGRKSPAPVWRGLEPGARDDPGPASGSHQLREGRNEKKAGHDQGSQSLRLSWRKHPRYSPEAAPNGRHSAPTGQGP